MSLTDISQTSNFSASLTTTVDMVKLPRVAPGRLSCPTIRIHAVSYRRHLVRVSHASFSTLGVRLTRRHLHMIILYRPVQLIRLANDVHPDMTSKGHVGRLRMDS